MITVIAKHFAAWFHLLVFLAAGGVVLFVGWKSLAACHGKTFGRIGALVLLLLAAIALAISFASSGTPEEKTRLWLGLFFTVMAVSMPVGGLCLLWYLFRNASPQMTRVACLVLATGFLLLNAFALWSFCVRHSHDSIPLSEYVLNGSAVLWLAGAVGMFFRQRLGWLVNMAVSIGGVILFGYVFSSVWTLIFYPDTETMQVREMGLGGYWFGVAAFLSFSSAAATGCLLLLFQLLRLRSEILRPPERKPPFLPLKDAQG